MGPSPRSRATSSKSISNIRAGRRCWTRSSAPDEAAAARNKRAATPESGLPIGVVSHRGIVALVDGLDVHLAVGADRERRDRNHLAVALVGFFVTVLADLLD